MWWALFFVFFPIFHLAPNERQRTKNSKFTLKWEFSSTFHHHHQRWCCLTARESETCTANDCEKFPRKFKMMKIAWENFTIIFWFIHKTFSLFSSNFFSRIRTIRRVFFNALKHGDEQDESAFHSHLSTFGLLFIYSMIHWMVESLCEGVRMSNEPGNFRAIWNGMKMGGK